MRTLNAVLTIAFAGATLAASPGSSLPPDQTKAARSITADGLRAHIRFLSSDLLEGRGPSTRGDQLAEAYIQSEMEAMGVRPGLPGGGWIQKVPLVGIKPTFTAPAEFRSNRGTATGVFGESFVAASGVQKPETQVDGAEIVFVGYGIVAPEFQWDDYKDTDLQGKVLLVMNNDPESDPKLFGGKTRLWYGRWDYKYWMAGKKGAAAAIIIHTTPSAGYPWQVVQSSWSGEIFQLPDDGSPRVQVKAWATEDLARKLAELGGKNLDDLRASAESRSFRPVPLGVRMSLSFTNTITEKESGNVVGMIPGSNPSRSGEAVIYTAHHDHLGIKSGAKPGDDAIYNGALDNASGVSAILSVARAFMDLEKRPQRSVYFAFVAAEEQNLLGSEFFAKHPPVASGRIVANINVDGVNFYGRTRDVAVIGFGKSSLDRDVEALVRVQGRVAQPDQFPDRGSFYRSDQLNFARIGVPAVYLKRGTDVIGKPAGFGREQIERYEKKDYHQPSDKFQESWDLSGAVEDVQLIFYLGCRIADARGIPAWNKGDEFEAARLKAIADLGSGSAGR